MPAASYEGTIRPARLEDVAQMARLNVRSWQETYRGLMSDAVLDDPGFTAARERFWTAALTDERYCEFRQGACEPDPSRTEIFFDTRWATDVFPGRPLQDVFTAATEGVGGTSTDIIDSPWQTYVLQFQSNQVDTVLFTALPALVVTPTKVGTPLITAPTEPGT